MVTDFLSLGFQGFYFLDMKILVWWSGMSRVHVSTPSS